MRKKTRWKFQDMHGCEKARKPGKPGKLTVKDEYQEYPVHNAQVLFSAMDLLSGFWQINLDETSKQKTAVATRLHMQDNTFS